MATVLSDAIRRIRNYKRLLEEYGENEAYNKIIAKEWENIRSIYRSDEEQRVFEVEGLDEYDICYWSLNDLMFDIVDKAEEGYEFTIKVKRMRGTDIGRMRILDI
ncbi:MAG: hypothetical protein AAFV93_22660 [Chloroflexota bacterium]